ncbi:MAG: MlaD family protein [Desulfobacteraceae bacterium]|nr:MlaD family protein [Desulfobacteraceae bacterium]
MEMEFSKMERLVGAFIVAVILLLMATVVIIGRGKDWFKTYVTYYTSFNETYNLQENAAVKLFRADIGKVADITLEKNRVLVKLAIFEKYASRIRQDAVATVESPTLIGSEYIAIIPGSTDAPLIAHGGEIPSREKRSITDVLTEFEVEKAAKTVVKAIQEISQVTETLSRTDGPLMISLKNVEVISTNLKQITTDLESGKGPMGLMLKSENVLQQMVDSIARLEQILEDIQTVVAKAPHTMDLVQENLIIYRDTGASIQASVKQAQQILSNIQRSADDLQAIMGNVKDGSQKVPQISTSFAEGIEEIRQGVEQVNRVVDSLQQNVIIRGNLPAEAPPAATDAGARP